jgi:superfamily II DNA or RNA helicase
MTVQARLPDCGQRTLTLVKHGNMLYVSPDGKEATSEEVINLLHGYLTYEHKEFLFGWKARHPVTGEKRRVQSTERRLYGTDARGRLFTNFGFFRRVGAELKASGYAVKFINVDPPTAARPRPECYTPNLANVTRCFQFRERQYECLRDISRNVNGVVHAVTGFGKMAMIAMTCLLYPKAKVHVVTRRVPLVNKLVDYLTRYIPNVGQYGDGKKYFGDRVTVFTAASLKYTDYDADFLLGDEAHELAAEESSAVLAGYQRTRNFAFTATPSGRGDGADARLEALFGPTIFYLPYWEAVDLDLVVPIRVIWRDVVMDVNPAGGCADVERKRRGVWFNDYRNDLIAGDLSNLGEDEQVLVLTDTIFHAVELKRRLPDYTLVYDKMELTRMEKYKTAKILPADEPVMTPERKERLRRLLEAGVGNYIATPTWAVGIDPIHLTQLVMAGSTASEILAVQAPGRVSRTNSSGGKQLGVVRDYRDQFDDGLRRNARKRYGIYASLRWEQVIDREGQLTECPG